MRRPRTNAWARLPGWAPAMASFFLGAVLVSAVGGPLLVGLLVGALAAWWAPALLRDPPWTARGRFAWRARLAAVATLGRAARAWWALARRAGPFAGRGGDPFAAPGGGEPGTGGAPWTVDPADARTAARFDAAFAVRCEVATARVQVWHSTDTGRAYEVDPRSAPADARPGDLGWLAFEGGRPRVRLEADRGRVLN